MDDREIRNWITMIGCNSKEFINIINNGIGKIIVTSGSWYTPYTIIDQVGILAKYDTKGNLLYNRI